MTAFRRRAIAASALPEQADALCRVLKEIGFSEIVCVSDGLSAIRRAQEAPTDLIAADAVLPVLDGISLEKRIHDLPMNVYPTVVLLAGKGMCLKSSVPTLEKPVNAEILAEVIDSLSPEYRGIPEHKRLYAQKLLDSIGIPQRSGGEYLLRAIEIVWMDGRLIKSLSTCVYPAVAAQFGTDAKQAARAMRHAIDTAWRSGEMDAQYKIFGDTIDAGRGNPTLSEMIARIADILRWEGKA